MADSEAFLARLVTTGLLPLLPKPAKKRMAALGTGGRAPSGPKTVGRNGASQPAPERETDTAKTGRKGDADTDSDDDDGSDGEGDDAGSVDDNGAEYADGINDRPQAEPSTAAGVAKPAVNPLAAATSAYGPIGRNSGGNATAAGSRGGMGAGGGFTVLPPPPVAQSFRSDRRLLRTVVFRMMATAVINAFMENEAAGNLRPLQQ